MNEQFNKTSSDRKRDDTLADAGVASFFKKEFSKHTNRLNYRGLKSYMDLRGSILKQSLELSYNKSFREKDIDYFTGQTSILKENLTDFIKNNNLYLNIDDDTPIFVKEFRRREMISNRSREKIKISIDDDNVFRRIYDSHNVVANSQDVFKGMFWKEQEVKVKSLLHNKYSGNSKSRSKSINKMVDQFKSNPTKYFYKDDNGDTIYRTDRLQEIFKGANFTKNDIEEILLDYQDFNKKASSDIKKYMKDKGELFQSLSNKMLDPDELIKKYGLKEKEDDKVVTVRDIIENRSKFKNKKVNVNENHDFDIVVELINLTKKHPELNDLIVDKNLRKDSNGLLFSIKEFNDNLDKVKKNALNKPLAKAFKLDELSKTEKSNISIFPKGSINRILSAAESEDGTVGRLKSNYFYINNKFYKEQDGKLIEDESLSRYKVIKSRDGASGELIKSLLGEGRGSTDNKSFLDIRHKFGPGKIEDKINLIKKTSDSDWEGNVVNSLLDDQELLLKLKNNQPLSNTDFEKSAKRLSTINKIFKDSSFGVEEKTGEYIREYIEEVNKPLFDLLGQDTDEILNTLSGYNIQNISNRDLAGIVTSLKSDRAKLMSRFEIKKDNLLLGESKTKIGIDEILNREITKEVLLSSNEDIIKEILEDDRIPNKEKTNIKRLRAWSEFQKITGSTGYESDFRDEGQVRNSLTQVYNMLTDENDETGFSNVLKGIMDKRFHIASKGKFDKEKYSFGERYPDEIIVGKAVGILDAINNETKRKAFFKQFNAGIDNPEDITTATLIPYYFANKLNKALDPIGLSLSGTDATSTGELLLNLGVKRLLPAAVGIKSLSYIDYRMEAYTGTSFRGSMANILSNADLGVRRTLDATGISENLKSQREYNPILRYLFGKEYMDSEKRLDWYREGYSPVRSNRYWSFMSLNEFRGGKINYFQPNWFKRAHSNAYDVSVYGSTKDKWKYSLLPTPRHPFSTLRRILDPYRLERQNYMDRPYHVTGDMFGHEIPGSAFLNATVGRILKPGSSMHTRTTSRNFMDSRSIIEEENRRLREQANSNLIQLDDSGDIVPISYHSFKPYGTQDLNIHIEDGQLDINIKTYDETPGIDIKQFEQSYNEIMKTRDEILNSGKLGKDGKFTSYDLLKEEVRRKLGNPFADIQEQYIRQETVSKNEINKLNKEILDKSNQIEKGAITKDGLPKTGPGTGMLFDSETMSDLRTTTSTHNYLNDLNAHTRSMMGLHGFALNKILPMRRSNTLADASRMTSTSRRFWDMSLGGLGGRPAHAIRKFIPHENHAINRINTIRNTMPEWMPDRFKYGDPYSMIPKGEMRLPGTGYESMFELHPDEFGERYGSFDRMKILADIAPWSSEYKMWRDIANKEVQDPKLRQEMANIKERVEEQSKQHDFYHYRFLGQKTDSREVTIDNVFEGNKFTVRGDDQIYRLGKIDEMSEDATNLFHAGMTVRMTTGRDEADDVDAKAAIIHYDGVNINKQLLQNNLATEGKTETVIDARATLDGTQIAKGKIWEAIAHADIPIIHKKFLNINDPLESYKQERIYGTNHSTWSNPIKGWLQPTIREASIVGPVRHSLGLGAWYLAENLLDSETSTLFEKYGGITAMSLLNKGAIAGGIIASIPNMGIELDTFMKGARVGTAVQALGYTYANKSNFKNSVIGAATAGAIIGEQLFSNKMSGAAFEGLKIGAMAGAIFSGFNTSIFNKGYSSQYISKDLEKRWEIDEYYDRLEYIKYKGLFEKTSKLAKRHEGVDIKQILDDIDKNKEDTERIRKELLNSREKVSNIYSEGDLEGQRLIKEIDHKLGILNTPESIIQGGQYSRMAVAYKQAMDSTIYGLDENSNWTQILRALPKNERDYMLEFAKEQDEKKRKEIYELVSPYQRKILDIAWGRKVKEQQSNLSYFMNHEVKNSFWSGWKTTTDLESVKLKTIENEGMLLSDFGHYESELSDPSYRYTPEIKDIKSKPISSLKNTFNLLQVMSGSGLSVNDISVTPSNKPGIKARINVHQSRTQELKREVSKKLGLPTYG